MQHNPTKVDEIPKLLEKYKGKEYEFIQKLEKKYSSVLTMIGMVGIPYLGNSPSDSASASSGLAIGLGASPGLAIGLGASPGLAIGLGASAGASPGLGAGLGASPGLGASVFGNAVSPGLSTTEGKVASSGGLFGKSIAPSISSPFDILKEGSLKGSLKESSSPVSSSLFGAKSSGII
jgi:hypothetical protein